MVVCILTLCNQIGYIEQEVDMKFKQYLDSENISAETAANALDTTVVSINRYINGNRIPKFDMILKIKNWTKDKVMPNDWYLPANDNEPLPPDGVA